MLIVIFYDPTDSSFGTYMIGINLINFGVDVFCASMSRVNHLGLDAIISADPGVYGPPILTYKTNYWKDGPSPFRSFK